MNGLFHRDIVLPEMFVLQAAKTVSLTFSHHAQRAAINDRYGIIYPPKTISPKPEQIIEVEVVNGRVVKSVARIPYDKEKDLIMVYNPDGFVRTMWFNLISDSHKTLKRYQYVQSL